MPVGESQSGANKRRLVRTKRAAQYADLTEGFLEKDRVSGRLKIPFIKIGKSVRYDLDDLDRWLAERRFTATAQYEMASTSAPTDQEQGDANTSARRSRRRSPTRAGEAA